jgi:gamma-glutamyl-gamma-aminobutyrate hydrolase PuuD
MDYTYDEYSRAIYDCGGASVLMPEGQNRDALQVILDRLDGLILSGGPNINPSRQKKSDPIPPVFSLSPPQTAPDHKIFRRIG